MEFIADPFFQAGCYAVTGFVVLREVLRSLYPKFPRKWEPIVAGFAYGVLTLVVLMALLLGSFSNHHPAVALVAPAVLIGSFIFWGMRAFSRKFSPVGPVPLATDGLLTFMFVAICWILGLGTLTKIVPAQDISKGGSTSALAENTLSDEIILVWKWEDEP